MTGIRVTMSNGEVSPIYKTRGQQVGLQTLKINQALKVRKVSLRTKDVKTCYGVKLATSTNHVICEWDESNRNEWVE